MIGSVPVARTAGPVSLTVVGGDGVTDDIVDGFTYELPADGLRVVNEPASATATVISDPIVRR